jgi:hypothetical protein
MVKLYAKPMNNTHNKCLLNQKDIASIKIEDVNINNPKNNNENDNVKSKYTKVLVNNPYYNRDIILKITKRQKGVYI